VKEVMMKNMRKCVGLAFFIIFGAAVAAEEAQESPSDRDPVVLDDFLELAEPERNISGAYWGTGLTLSNISYHVKVVQYLKGMKTTDFHTSGSQFDISLIGGFGTTFYKRYYAGIEMDFFKRLGSKRNYHSDGDVGVRFDPTLGLNMDVRFGKLFPDRGLLAYVTVGFSRVLGKVVVEQWGYPKEGSFGSFYPTFGLGIEKKVNSLWNVRGDFRISITNNDDKRYIRGTGNVYDGQPERWAVRISVTRSII
jgi:hypothetical protein